MAAEPAGRLLEEFEESAAQWLGVRNVIGFSSRISAMRSLTKTQRPGPRFGPSLGLSAFCAEERLTPIESEPGTYGMCPSALSDQLREDGSAVYATHIAGRPCLIEPLEDLCNEWGVPLFLFGHQAFGATYQRERLGGFGHAELFELGRDQLVHAMDAAIITTNDDLLAHRLRVDRGIQVEGIDPAMGDAAAAMGIANLESCDTFIEGNRSRYKLYAQHLSQVPGIKLLRLDASTTAQTITIEVDPGLAGLNRNALADVLAAENVGVQRLFGDSRITSTPLAYKLSRSLLQLPSGPAATDETIEAVCKLVELAIVRSLESPDPIRLAA